MLPLTPYWLAMGPTQSPPALPKRSQQVRTGTVPPRQPIPAPLSEKATTVFSIVGGVGQARAQIPAPLPPKNTKLS